MIAPLPLTGRGAIFYARSGTLGALAAKLDTGHCARHRPPMPLNDAHFGGHTRKAPTMTAALAGSSWGPFFVPGVSRPRSLALVCVREFGEVCGDCTALGGGEVDAVI